jgi:hypothetical protein
MCHFGVSRGNKVSNKGFNGAVRGNPEYQKVTKGVEIGAFCGAIAEHFKGYRDKGSGLKNQWGGSLTPFRGILATD